MISSNHLYSRCQRGDLAPRKGLKYNRRLARNGDIRLKHYSVLSTILVLLVGVWAIFAFYQKSRRFPDSRLRDLLRYLIFFNIIELEYFLLIYFDSNLTPLQSESFFSWYKDIDWPLRTLLILGLFVSLYKVIAWLRGKELPKWILPALVLFAAILMGLFFLAMRSPEYMPKDPRINFWNLYGWPLILLGMVWLIKLLAENRQGSDPDRERANRAFAWLFLLRIPVQLAVLLLNLGPFDFWNITLSKLLSIYTNIIPIFWLRAYFIPWAGSLGKIIAGRVDMASLQKKHGLSAREMEILNLMIDGKSYKQMEQALHISIHTVKSHAYNLYRKLKVKNRHQLIHLISASQQDNP
jgi:DNA-binding CsgD family transcriptional regulator